MSVASELLKLTAAGIVGGVVTLAGSTLEYFNKGRELDIRMVDVALTILSAKDEGTKTEQARRYALDVLEKYARVQIKDKETWVKGGEVPIGGWDSYGWSSDLLNKYRFDHSKPTPPFTIVPSVPKGNSEPETMPQ